MTGGFLRVPIMRPHHCWTVLHVSFLAGLLLTLNADSEDSDCNIELRVRHGTVYEAVFGGDLRINCTVAFCNSSPPTVTWYKRDKTDIPVNVSSSRSHIKMEWKLLNHLEGRSMLVFQNVLRNDSGLYHCRTGDSVSHNINVSVHGNGENSNVTQKNDTRGTMSNPESTPDLWMYMYFAAGTVAFVLIVMIISVVSMRGCKGKSKRETQTENQYMAIPIVERPFPHVGLQPSPRGSPSAPLSQRSTRRVRPPSQPIELALPRDSDNLYGKVEKDRDRLGNMEEEGGSVVYAALNHQLPARAAARPRRPKEETSEYAAIRVKDP